MASYTLLLTSELFPGEKRKVQAFASTLEELIEGATAPLGLAPDGFALAVERPGMPLEPATALDEIPLKAKVVLVQAAAAAAAPAASAAAAAVAREYSLMLVACDLNPENRRLSASAAEVWELALAVREDLQLDFDLELLVPSGGGWAPLQSLEGAAPKLKIKVERKATAEAREFTLLVSSTDGTVSAPRRCTVTAASVDELSSALGRQLHAAAPLVVSHDGRALTSLDSLPSKAKVTVFAGISEGVPTASATVRTGSPPEPPSAPTLTAATADTLEIQWTPAPTGAEVDGYNVEKREGDDGWERIPMRIRGNTACLDGFGPVSSCTFRIVAINSFGESPPGDDSDALTTKPGVPDPPSPPQPTSSTWADIALTWDSPKDNGAAVESFTVQQRTEDSEAWSIVGTTPANAIAASNLAPDTSYVYRVSAMNAAGSSLPGQESEPITTAPGPPGPAGMPRAVTVSPTSMSIEWDEAVDHGSPIESYTVESAAASQPDQWVTVANTGNAPTLTCNDLRPLTGYLFRVTAANAVGEARTGPTSQPITTKAAPPAQPCAPRSVGVTANSLTIEWDAPDDFGTPISGYRVECKEPGRQDYRAVSAHQAELQFYSGDLPPASSYLFRVTAISAAGESEVSAASDRMQTRAAPPSRPFPPTLQGESTSSALSVGWEAPNDNGSPIVSFRCEVLMPAGGWTLVYEGMDRSAVAEGLAPATEYLCRVTATNGEGDSSNGEEAAFTTAAERPSTPAPPVLYQTTGSELTLSWAEPDANGAAITSYELQRQAQGHAAWETVAADVAGTTASVAKGEEEETLFFRVIATNAAGSSDPSDASQAIRSEAAMRKFMLLVTSDLFSEKKKVALEAGSIDHLTTSLQMKLGLMEQIQVLSDAGVLLTSLDQIADKAKVTVRPLHTPAAPAAGPGKRDFTLLITSTFFADKRKVQVSAGSVAELTSALEQSLGLTQRFAIVIHDEDFDEDRQIFDLEDIETDKAKVQLVAI